MKAICFLLFSIFTSIILAQVPRLIPPVGRQGHQLRRFSPDGVLKGKFVVKGKKDAVPELVEKILAKVSGLL